MAYDKYFLSESKPEISPEKLETIVRHALIEDIGRGDITTQLTIPKEGKVDLKAKYNGLLKINLPLLDELNSREDIIVSTIHHNTVCHHGMTVAGTRIIPLFIADSRLQEIEALTQAQGKVLQLLPLPTRKIGIVVTGSEVFKGRIEDKFADIVQKKVEEVMVAQSAQSSLNVFLVTEL